MKGRHAPRENRAGLSLSLALHIACSLTPNFGSLLILRAFAGLAGAMSGPAASVAAASLAPPERRGSALAMVSGGMTLAFVVGIPIGSVIGNLFTWRATFLVSCSSCRACPPRPSATAAA